MFRYRQSSEPKTTPPPPPRIDFGPSAWVQSAPIRVASRVPAQGWTGRGARQRNSPTGGTA